MFFLLSISSADILHQHRAIVNHSFTKQRSVSSEKSTCHYFILFIISGRNIFYSLIFDTNMSFFDERLFRFFLAKAVILC